MAHSARALDPSEITYSLQVAALHRERGESEAADTMHQNLDQNFQVYLGMMGQQVTEKESEPAPGKKPALDPDAQYETMIFAF